MVRGIHIFGTMQRNPFKRGYVNKTYKKNNSIHSSPPSFSLHLQKTHKDLKIYLFATKLSYENMIIVLSVPAITRTILHSSPNPISSLLNKFGFVIHSFFILDEH